MMVVKMQCVHWVEKQAVSVEDAKGKVVCAKIVSREEHYIIVFLKVP